MDAQALSATKSYSKKLEGLDSSFSSSPAPVGNIFHSILSHKGLDTSEKQFKRIAQEGFVAIAAGGETTGRALTTATFFILANSERILPRLQQELRQVMPHPEDRPSLHELQKLPWLVCNSMHRPNRPLCY